jgi:hypothetical protein
VLEHRRPPLLFALSYEFFLNPSFNMAAVAATNVKGKVGFMSTWPRESVDWLRP